MLKTGGAVFIFVISIWLTENYVEAGVSRTCGYFDLCEREITPPPDCGPWPWCRNFTVRVPCRKIEPCTEDWGSFSFCTRLCGGGRRFRTGVCVGENCRRVISESEPCNTEPCDDRVDGNWSEWTPWASTSCSETCCGGTYTMTRTRSCTDDSGTQCVGEDTDRRDNMPCGMTENCPLSCENQEMATMFGDPCGVCSNRFFACAGDAMPMELECPSGTYWSNENTTCQAMSMCEDN